MTAEDAPLVKLVNAVFVSSIKKRARFLSWAPGRVWFFRKGAWYEEMRVPVALHTLMMRRLSVMIGHLAPGRVGERITGGIVLDMGVPPVRHFFAMLIERVLYDRRALHRAFLERLSEEDWDARRPLEPHLPANPPIPGFSVISDPYRGITLGTLFTDAIVEPPALDGSDLDAMVSEVEDALIDK